MSRGSTWNKWDFHVHTPYSILNNQFGDPDSDDTWEKYVTALEEKSQELGIVAIGVTDYFMIDGYKRLVKYQKQGRLSGLLLFPNIEFRLNTEVTSSDGSLKRLNYHVLFSPDVPEKQIEENFLQYLVFARENHPFDPDKPFKLTRANLEEFGKQLLAQEPKFKGKSPLEVGCVTAVVRAEDIQSLLKGRFRGDHMLVLAEEGISLLKWGTQSHGVRLQLYQMSHAMFSSNLNTKRFCLGKEYPSGVPGFLIEFKSLMPCIWGCDSHGYDERFLEPDEKRYCWIKGEATWEGLKQILFEPECRVKIQTECPESQKSIYTLDQVSISKTQFNTSLQIDDVQLDLNRNLVAIIGGRGSGKTALLDLIAACFREGRKLKDIDTSFFHRLYRAKRGNGLGDSEPVEVALRLRSGDEFRKRVGEEDDVYEKADVVYLTQNHFEEFSANPQRLYEHVFELVFDRYPDERLTFEDMQENQVALSKDIQMINLKMEQLQSEIRGKKEQAQETLLQKRGERDDVIQRITETEQLREDEIDDSERLSKALGELRQKRQAIQILIGLLSPLSSEIESFHANYRTQSTVINSSIQALSDDPPLKSMLQEIRDLTTISGLITENIKLSEVTRDETGKQMEETRSEIEALKGIQGQLGDLRQSAHNIDAEISALVESVSEIEEREKEIEDLNRSRLSKLHDALLKNVELEMFLQVVIDKFEAGKGDILDEVQFFAEINFRRRPGIFGDIEDRVDGRQHRGTDLEERLTDMWANLLTRLDTDADTIDLMEQLEELERYLAALHLRSTVHESDFANIALQNYFDIGLRIEFKGRPVESLSMGERAVVLLKIVLALDDKPLLIDQPEEHLDNRFIYSNLMPAFRDAKTRRQIIIATHNANLVINTDAEQIVLASHDDGNLTYRVGTLEDITLREELTEILEGGHEAFKKREEKYGFIF